MSALSLFLHYRHYPCESGIRSKNFSSEGNNIPYYIYYNTFCIEKVSCP